MIDWIAIRQFAITDEVELELDNRFTAVTGETGSGKSLLVDALSILLGARADSAVIQHGKEQAEIQAGFRLDTMHPAFDWLHDNDLANDQECLLRRVVRRDKPGRGFINGRAVNISMLRDLGALLVDIHGQHEHHSLLRRPVQLGLLDDAAGNRPILQEVADCHENLAGLRKQLDRVDQTRQSTSERMDLLKFQLGELERLDPKQGEWQALELRHKRLQHGQELISNVQTIIQSLVENDDHNLHRELVRLSAKLQQLGNIDPNLNAIAAMLDESAVNVEEAARQLGDSYRDAEVDPEELAQIEQRFSNFHELARKHRVEPDQLASHFERLSAELSGLSNPEAERARLQSAIEDALIVYRDRADKLTKSRKSWSKKLAKQITAAMQDLGMQGGRFDIELRPIAEGESSRTGSETVEFMVSANPGVPLQPLSRVASGGEISRMSLAIQVILANAAKVPTLIFDEVDVGIGGTVANMVGQRLHQLGEARQVICITHLAQVAARADHHFAVTKESDGKNNPRVAVLRLDQEQRVAEIARMSGSEKLTEQSRAHAEQLLATG